MNFEYRVQDETKKTNDEINKELVASIPKSFDKWDDARKPQIDDIKLLRKLIYTKPSEKIEFGEDIVLPELYELSETLTSHIWESVYSTPQNMFNVEGRDQEAQSNSPKQKAMLVNALEDMKVQLELEKVVKNGIETGDLIAFVGWETRVKQVRRKKTDLELAPEKLMSTLTGQKVDNFKIEEITEFEGAKVTAIKTENFAYDVTKVINWDSCPKIIRSLSTYDDILSEKNFTLDKETKEELKNIVENKDDENDQGDSQEETDEVNRQRATEGDQIELLEYWGDIKLKDGTILRNWLIVVAGRCRVIRFEANPFIINPIVYANLIEDPEIKRGISPLRVAVNLSLINSDLVNKNVDILALIMNPPYLVAEGAMSGKVKLTPGHIQEYNPAIMTKEPIKLDFSQALISWDFIQFFKKNIESSTGIFAYMSGTPQDQPRTATETNALVGGQSARLSKTIDCINQKLIIPIVERVADLISNYEFGDKELGITKEDGNIQGVQINDTVRQGNYKYTYSDSKAGAERKAQFKEFISFVEAFAKYDPNLINAPEVFKYGLEQLGVENTERFIMQDPLQQSLNQVPEQLRDPVKQKLTNVIPLAAQEVMNEQQGTGTIPIQPSQNIQEQPPMP